ncbi:hypothetical protein HY030_01190 [Candidatus Gottesmanbacteria bacterium]|nr:hypothetical protein [Candidatus Gottesmanbacteria bacterium]
MFLLFIILVFLESSFLSVNLLLAAILAAGMIKIDKSLILAVFFSGLIFDILNVRLVGVTSLFYLTLCLLLFLYQKKFKTKNLFYIVIFGLVIFTIDNIIFKQNISVLMLVLELLGLFSWYELFSLFGDRKKLYG